uniref:Uncharacterized protein n=1 Tax=Osmundaria fimbriata TaxID=228265 RepID=A0A1Z1M4D5_OSMFI|nr:hypothetical protein [Osmundaria fimbriata]ARW60909.1 hypothetical protein [Osmundaria fimbriata]
MNSCTSVNKSVENYCCTINIQQILKNTKKTVSCKSYQNFMSTVDKLSHVILDIIRKCI